MKKRKVEGEIERTRMQSKIFIMREEVESGRKERKSVRMLMYVTYASIFCTCVCNVCTSKRACMRAHRRRVSRTVGLSPRRRWRRRSLVFLLFLVLLSLAHGVHGCILRPSRARRCRWSHTTAFAFFGEVKAVSGKFWWRAGVRSLARSRVRSFVRRIVRPV